MSNETRKYLEEEAKIAGDRALRELAKLEREIAEARAGIENWIDGGKGLPVLDVAGAARAAEATKVYEAFARSAAFAREIEKDAPFGVGDVVRHTDSPDELDQRAVVAHVDRDGLLTLVAPGAEGVGVDVLRWCSPGDSKRSDGPPRGDVVTKADEVAEAIVSGETYWKSGDQSVASRRPR